MTRLYLLIVGGLLLAACSGAPVPDASEPPTAKVAPPIKAAADGGVADHPDPTGICASDWYERHSVPNDLSGSSSERREPTYMVIHPEGVPPPTPGKWVEQRNYKWSRDVGDLALDAHAKIQLVATVTDAQGRPLDGDFGIRWGVCPVAPDSYTPPEWSLENPAVVESVRDGLVVTSDVGGYAVVNATLPEHGLGARVLVRSPVPFSKVVGTVDPVEITNDEQHVSNRQFRGRAYLMFNYHGASEREEPTEAEGVKYHRVTKSGGDLLSLYEGAICAPTSGGLLLFNGLLLGSGVTEYGAFYPIPCGPLPRYYVVDWWETGKRGQSDLLCKKDNCPHKHLKGKMKYQFSSEDLVVEAKWAKTHCSDTTVNEVTIRDREGGTLVLKNMLDFGVIEIDADQDGTKELYITSTQGCGRWLKVIKVVPE